MTVGFDSRQALSPALEKAEIVSNRLTRYAASAEIPQSVVYGTRDDDEWGVELLEHVSVMACHHAREFAQVVSDPVELDSGGVREGYRFVRRVKTEHRGRRRKEHASEIDVAIGRRKAVEMRAADCGEQASRPALGYFSQVVLVEVEVFPIRCVHFGPELVFVVDLIVSLSSGACD